MNSKLNLLPRGLIKAAFKFANLPIFSNMTVLKNNIVKASTFYKSLLGVAKVPRLPSVIHLKPKSKEGELLAKLKVKEDERDHILAKLDATKNALQSLERDHAMYRKYLKYLFSLVALVSIIIYANDNKNILEKIDEVVISTLAEPTELIAEANGVPWRSFLLVILLIISIIVF